MGKNMIILQRINITYIFSFFLFMIALTLVTGCSNYANVSNDTKKATTTNSNPIINKYIFTQMPDIDKNSNVTLGGFSGLFYNGSDASKNELSFTTVTDKLPSSYVEDHTVLSNFFNPSIVNFILNTDKKEIALNQIIPIKPQLNNDIANYKNFDYEGIIKTDSNDYWVVEESIPAVVHVNSTGMILQRFVPFKTTIDKLSIDKEALPEKYNHLKKNGFEGIAYNKTTNKLYMFLQNKLSPKIIDFNKHTKNTTWVVEFDISKQKVTGEFLYPSANKLKLSGATHYKNNEFLVIERSKIKKSKLTNYTINRVSFENATNVIDYFVYDEENDILKLKNPAIIDSIKPIEITTYINLSELGYNKNSKFEGIAYLGDEKTAIVNDNDFGIETDEDSDIIIIDLK